MKKTLMAVAALMMSAGFAAADPIEGMWKTQPDDGKYAHIKMGKCGSAICGKIAKTFDSSGEIKTPNIGKTLVIDMVPQGGGAYAGKVWRPSNNKIYTGKMQLDGNSLTMKGCVAGGLLCSKQRWSRIQ